MVALCSTVLVCPRIVRICLSNFVFRMGHIVFYHLAADAACLTGQGDIQLVAIGAHNCSLLFGFPESKIYFPDWRVISFPRPCFVQTSISYKWRVAGNLRKDTKMKEYRISWLLNAT